MSGDNEILDPTIPEDLNVQVRGFEEKLAYNIGHKIRAAVREYSRVLPLENLDGITIGYDYNEALASIDTGFPSNGPITPTQDEEFGSGAAMALPVDREGVLKTHLVFGPMIAAYLLESDDNEEQLRRGLGLITHELGHAVDHEYKYQAFGNIMAQRLDTLVSDPVEQYLWELSHFMWDEYCANRIATMLQPRGSDENTLFLSVHASFRSRIFDARNAYQCRVMTLDEFLAVVKHNLHLALIATAYLLGMNDVDKEELPSTAEEATALLQGPESADLLAFHDVLVRIWENRGKWQSYDEILELNKPALALLHSFNLYPSVSEGGGLYMDVP